MELLSSSPHTARAEILQTVSKLRRRVYSVRINIISEGTRKLLRRRRTSLAAEKFAIALAHSWTVWILARACNGNMHIGKSYCLLIDNGIGSILSMQLTHINLRGDLHKPLSGWKVAAVGATLKPRSLELNFLIEAPKKSDHMREMMMMIWRPVKRDDWQKMPTDPQLILLCKAISASNWNDIIRLR